jgi:hypothetical protein
MKQKALDLLRPQTSQQEPDSSTAEWRNDGTLVGYKRAGMEFSNRAKQMSNGYYKIIRKKYLGMRWADKVTGRNFGFSNPTEAIHYYLDELGNPRPCTYCGRVPEKGKVWGLDRIDSSLGHIPGNLVPCCSSHPESSMLSCQASKSKFSIRAWLEMALTRAYGHQIPSLLVDMRVTEILTRAKSLAEKENKLWLETPTHSTTRQTV